MTNFDRDYGGFASYEISTRAMLCLSAKDHFNFSSYKVVKLLTMAEHNYKHSRWQLGMNNREQMSIA